MRRIISTIITAAFMATLSTLCGCESPTKHETERQGGITSTGQHPIDEIRDELAKQGIFIQETSRSGRRVWLAYNRSAAAITLKLKSPVTVGSGALSLARDSAAEDADLEIVGAGGTLLGSIARTPGMSGGVNGGDDVTARQVATSFDLKGSEHVSLTTSIPEGGALILAKTELVAVAAVTPSATITAVSGAPVTASASEWRLSVAPAKTIALDLTITAPTGIKAAVIAAGLLLQEKVHVIYRLAPLVSPEELP